MEKMECKWLKVSGHRHAVVFNEDIVEKLDEIVQWINEHEKGADIDYERTARRDVGGGDPAPK